MAPLITLLTDFGTSDSYVAEVKAVLLSRALGAALVDVTHQIPPGDVRAGQYVLARVWQRSGGGTVHCVVVDPGVGRRGRGLAAEAAGHYFVAPDNGVLSPLPADTRFFELPVPPGAAPSFHGRDLFAPAAAELATGTALSHLGSPITDPCRAPLPAPYFDGPAVRGELIYVDPFGTLTSNIPGERVEPRGDLAPPLGRGEAVGALREVDRAGGAEQAHGPLLDFIRGQVSGVGCRGHLGPALRAPARPVFIPAGPGDGSAIRYAPCGYTSSRCPAAGPGNGRSPRRNALPRAPAGCRRGTRAPAARWRARWRRPARAPRPPGAGLRRGRRAAGRSRPSGPASWRGATRRSTGCRGRACAGDRSPRCSRS